MRRVSQLIFTGLASIAVSGLQAECAYPDDIKIPDGTTSTYEEMSDSQAFVKEYMAEMESYLACLELENTTVENSTLKSSTLKSSTLKSSTLANSGLTNELTGNPASPQTQRRRAAIDEMESVAAKFNEQVRAFKQTNP